MWVTRHSGITLPVLQTGPILSEKPNLLQTTRYNFQLTFPQMARGAQKLGGHDQLHEIKKCLFSIIKYHGFGQYWPLRSFGLPLHKLVCFLRLLTFVLYYSCNLFSCSSVCLIHSQKVFQPIHVLEFLKFASCFA